MEDQRVAKAFLAKAAAYARQHANEQSAMGVDATEASHGAGVRGQYHASSSENTVKLQASQARQHNS